MREEPIEARKDSYHQSPFSKHKTEQIMTINDAKQMPPSITKFPNLLNHLIPRIALYQIEKILSVAAANGDFVVANHYYVSFYGIHFRDGHYE